MAYFSLLTPPALAHLCEPGRHFCPLHLSELVLSGFCGSGPRTSHGTDPALANSASSSCEWRASCAPMRCMHVCVVHSGRHRCVYTYIASHVYACMHALAVDTAICGTHACLHVHICMRSVLCHLFSEELALCWRSRRVLPEERSRFRSFRRSSFGHRSFVNYFTASRR